MNQDLDRYDYSGKPESSADIVLQDITAARLRIESWSLGDDAVPAGLALAIGALDQASRYVEQYRTAGI